MRQPEGGSLNTTPTNVSRVPKPLTAIEQYWATRALKAEALLAAQDNHRKEFKTMEHVQDMKREREMTMLARQYTEKQASWERLLTFLLCLITLLILLIVYLATHYTRHSLRMQMNERKTWWSAVGASHFTIPILSPFTSVVEQETSVISPKLIGTVAAIAACLAYMVFRHWLANKMNGRSAVTAKLGDVTTRYIDR
ncbi:hypothetical protein BYT27DRAFT_7085261 [Phlegmacium glaucopus]|nr:hypothetical protein BYT27DRAFT_7085261 [Phlegmacium glaucopus]